MFSPRIKLALCILQALAKEKDTGRMLTLSVLKQRLGASFTTRDGIKVVRDLCNASLAGYEWKDDQPNYFYSEVAGKASLFDLVIAVEGRAGLGEKFGAGYFPDLPGGPSVAAHIEERFAFEGSEALKKIPLTWFFPGGRGSAGVVQPAEACRRKEAADQGVCQCEKCDNMMNIIRG